MPSLATLAQLSKSNRYTACVASTRKVHADDVWKQVMNNLGVEPVNAPTSSKIDKAPTSVAHVASAKSKTTFLDLPLETQKEIFRYVCIL